jgi:hypothetical protein
MMFSPCVVASWRAVRRSSGFRHGIALPVVLRGPLRPLTPATKVCSRAQQLRRVSWRLAAPTLGAPVRPSPQGDRRRPSSGTRQARVPHDGDRAEVAHIERGGLVVDRAHPPRQEVCSLLSTLLGLLVATKPMAAPRGAWCGEANSPPASRPGWSRGTRLSMRCTRFALSGARGFGTPAAAQSTIPKATPAAGAPHPGAPPARTDGAARFVPSAPCATAFREHSRPDREAQARQPQIDWRTFADWSRKEGRLVDRSLAPARRRQVTWRAHGTVSRVALAKLEVTAWRR